ncbi:hypothetical protein SAMN05661010_00869 [Modicisalibacter muralis]|uniref:Tat (Twin-arginine translocation) pathway signal sequence n=1 Tax=Modicisalibacter muralis TaxID=119000 RepID=A0A1G9GZ96_9GAMM|nr:DUF1513 domain-containing protein [Halomonas muralis]SDL05987.1 hypothetical protein SAMN05661010_00869 [Halomonas muralis]
MLSRRDFLHGSLTAAGACVTLAAGVTFGAGAAWARGENVAGMMLSAVDDDAGRHFIAGANVSGELLFRMPVPERCHGGCPRPGSAEVVMFPRRPGYHFYVVDVAKGEIQRTVGAGEDHHFYGHGAFSPDGRFLYVTTNHYIDGEGLISVFDADRQYARVARHPLGGIGPHELRLHPDGNTLVIGLGGIKTHPDLDRIKLNLDTMRPALLLMDRHSGEITGRFAPSHHQLSCRHLDIGADGVVVAGYQFQGPAWKSPPLIAVLDGRTREFREISLPEALQTSLRNYTASVAISPTLPQFAITAPRANRVIIYDYAENRLVKAPEVSDGAGVISDGAGGFIVSTGGGGLFEIPGSGDGIQRLASYSLHWDNHLTLA